MNSELISRKDVREKLIEWQSAQIKSTDIHEWAENIYASSRFHFDDWFGLDDAYNSVTNEVLSHLDQMNMNLTTVDEIPAFLACLDSPVEHTKVAIHELSKSLSKVDVHDRKGRLRSDPLYAPFCN